MKDLDLASLVNILSDAKLTLATAESCTAGLIASTLADQKGAAAVLDCAFVTYSPQAKYRCLGVDQSVLSENNLCSEAVARAMAKGAAQLTPANLIIANTGVADDIAEPQIPAGTQCFAWLFKPQDKFDPLVVYTETIVFDGTRDEIRQQSARYSLGRIEHWLRLAKQERQGVGPGV
ncbi:CinA family protein [Alcaligenes sp. HNGD-HTN06]|uniref:CinA family protein n=1 Tax=Alcaligenes sp. HNGD-HTN06 TaxID=3416924 RepID=UPI003CF81D71